ncbi:hypothetical protein DFR70_107232 [Nocardia tenerifensis]|uniref:DUF3052 family protein n=1 Tax=Nocardia tenerifensis TaxID=228006 RepID=A0A318K192_9NOCA|nr:DUF3052 family protein [Nocardia tenerifensis]PXX62364.1 hypothetical protein DFR70_107232 [Nocardia tenerifensis]
MTAGYSGTPLAKKLGIKPGHRIALRHSPPGWRVPDLPADVEFVDESPDVLLVFYRTHAELADEAPDLAARLPRGSMLWIAWPRKAGGHVSDIAENDLRAMLLPVGVVDVKVAAFDNDWSGLKFVWRQRN